MQQVMQYIYNRALKEPQKSRLGAVKFVALISMRQANNTSHASLEKSTNEFKEVIV